MTPNASSRALLFERQGSFPCHHCGETNMPEAVMCWACYSTLPDKWSRDHPKLARARRWWKLRAELWLRDGGEARAPWIVAAALASSLVWPRPWRPLALAASAAWGGAWLWRIGRRRLKAQEEEATDPITRIASTILHYAQHDGASGIRLEHDLEHDGRMVKVFYQVDGEWRDQMHIPSSIWEPLRHEMARRPRPWAQARRTQRPHAWRGG